MRPDGMSSQGSSNGETPFVAIENEDRQVADLAADAIEHVVTLRCQSAEAPRLRRWIDGYCDPGIKPTTNANVRFWGAKLTSDNGL
jgi:hypothetical protein